MITIEKDSKAEEICIHGTPESLRELAKRLWDVAEQGESQGTGKAQLSTNIDSEPQLSTKLRGEQGKYRVVKKLTLCGHAK